MSPGELLRQAEMKGNLEWIVEDPGGSASWIYIKKCISAALGVDYLDMEVSVLKRKDTWEFSLTNWRKDHVKT